MWFLTKRKNHCGYSLQELWENAWNEKSLFPFSIWLIWKWWTFFQEASRTTFSKTLCFSWKNNLIIGFYFLEWSTPVDAISQIYSWPMNLIILERLFGNLLKTQLISLIFDWTDLSSILMWKGKNEKLKKNSDQEWNYVVNLQEYFIHFCLTQFRAIAGLNFSKSNEWRKKKSGRKNIDWLNEF